MSKRATEKFVTAPLVRLPLLLLYICLALPLPLLSPPSLRLTLSLGFLLGAVLILGLVSEQVIISEKAIAVSYPAWLQWLPLRQNWTLPWEQVTALVPVTTSQKGTVYYIKAKKLRNYLLPQRLERFELFLTLVHEYSGIDTNNISRLTPPWTYQLLAALSLLMLLGEGVVAAAIYQGWIVSPVSSLG